ncbi:MAG: DNA-3-methyladenine glycosylase [Flavobacteriaceae bacterium]|nr:DNA-3-methyladenine glycosylase [Flavobacteriaceae bacterium]
MMLSEKFYLQPDVVKTAKELLGKKLCTLVDGHFTSGIITETEAYNGVIDKASHAYGGRRTARNEAMYSQGGKAYIYLCYGIHHLFNVVTGDEGTPTAVLIRAIEPLEGIEVILHRRNKTKLDKTLTVGPGSMSQALGISTKLNGILLQKQKIWIEESENKMKPSQILASPRIGVNYAGDDALLPYRFTIKGNVWCK